MLPYLTNFPDSLQDEYETYLKENFITPIEDLGFEFIGYGHMGSDEKYAATHILQFSQTVGYLDNSQIKAKLQELMTNDDNQPMSIFQRYFTTLWVYIPYVG